MSTPPTPETLADLPGVSASERRAWRRIGELRNALDAAEADAHAIRAALGLAPDVPTAAVVGYIRGMVEDLGWRAP